MSKFLNIVLVIISIGLIVVFVLNFTLPNKIIIEKESKSVDHNSSKDPEIIIFAVGDIMFDRGVEHMVNEHGDGDFKFPFLEIAHDLKKADILFGNLESVISDKGKKVGSIYSFRAEPEAINGLTYAGFDVLSVANNHSFDYGREALEDSLKRLEKAGIDYVGAGFNQEQVCLGVTKEIKETKITFLGYSSKGSEYWQAQEDSSGIGWLDEDIKNDIEKAEGDVVIVSLHFGEEYQFQPNSEQQYFSYLAIDSGADLVIGHHPHVVQPIERYKEGWIAYSLGNFVFDQGHIEGTMQGLLLEIVIQDKKIKQVNPKEIEISKHFQPYLSY